jgi:hypothetical protein
MFGQNAIWATLGTEFYWAHYLWYYPFNLVLTFGVGTIWYTLEKEILWDRKKRLNKNRLELLKAKGFIK